MTTSFRTERPQDYPKAIADERETKREALYGGRIRASSAYTAT
jgi:hypothetical protein